MHFLSALSFMTFLDAVSNVIRVALNGTFFVIRKQTPQSRSIVFLKCCDRGDKYFEFRQMQAKGATRGDKKIRHVDFPHNFITV